MLPSKLCQFVLATLTMRRFTNPGLPGLLFVFSVTNAIANLIRTYSKEVDPSQSSKQDVWTSKTKKTRMREILILFIITIIAKHFSEAVILVNKTAREYTLPIIVLKCSIEQIH
uniref:Uncharacterized protein n=1 Tax=Glossina palpalis gambiensis TaxID=67801 RepID=A0A1B0ANJ7_9MUSC